MPTMIMDSDCRAAHDATVGAFVSIQQAIASAIAAERERCAKIAEALSKKPGWSPGYQKAAAVIAKEIRSGKTR